MPRMALGSAAKNVMANTRVTKAEADALAEEFGSVSNALRAFINRWKKEKRNDGKGVGETARPVR
jgi:uncharacterized protein YejL (UPF0352 family)